MREFLAYLYPENQQGVEDIRIIQMLKTLDHEVDTVRFYIQGTDFQKNDVEHTIPFVTLNGKKKSFENLWKEVIGDKEIDTSI